jgi:two-component system, chemotaxis family, chemotaxis protein CheY
MPLQGKEILIIDDVADVRMLCRKVLENIGMVVSEADSVPKAITRLGEKTPHVILLDLQMPETTGFDFLSMRANNKGISEIPVIVLSTLGDKEAVHRAIALGANDYVLKPMNAAIVAQRVRKHVRDIDFKRYRFSEDGRPELTALVPAQIARVQEASFVIESAARIRKEARISIRPAQVDSIDVSNCVLQCDSEPGPRGINGQYLAKINVIGLDRSIPKKLKEREDL